MPLKSLSASQFGVTLSVMLITIVAGCSGSSDVHFRLNREGRSPADAKPEQKQQIVNGLVALFGEPDEPHDLSKFGVETGLNQNKLMMAAGPAKRTLDGGQRGLYREHCAHCHGVTGDGAGPTATFLNPYPRDYRNGTFKFTSTAANLRPTMDDLRKIIHQGIPGTAMPSFAMLPADEIEALAQYVKYLAMRGQVETGLYGKVVDDEEPLTREILAEELQSVVDGWNNAEASVVDPPPRLSELTDRDRDEKVTLVEALARFEENFAAVDANGDGLFDEQERLTAVVAPDPALYLAADGDGDGKVSHDEGKKWLENDFARSDLNDDEAVDDAEYRLASIEAGRKLFQDAKRSQCVKCHGPTGLGDGGEAIFDVWNEKKKDKSPGEIAERFSLPRQVLKPRNLRMGVYRGGMRPVDIYRRIHAGIKGAQMPNLGPSPGNAGVLKPEEIWQLVEYVRALPFDTRNRSAPMVSRVARDVN